MNQDNICTTCMRRGGLLTNGNICDNCLSEQFVPDCYCEETSSARKNGFCERATHEFQDKLDTSAELTDIPDNLLNRLNKLEPSLSVLLECPWWKVGLDD